MLAEDFIAIGESVVGGGHWVIASREHDEDPEQRERALAGELVCVRVNTLWWRWCTNGNTTMLARRPSIADATPTTSPGVTSWC